MSAHGAGRRAAKSDIRHNDGRFASSAAVRNSRPRAPKVSSIWELQAWSAARKNALAASDKNQELALPGRRVERLRSQHQESCAPLHSSAQQGRTQVPKCGGIWELQTWSTARKNKVAPCAEHQALICPGSADSPRDEAHFIEPPVPSKKSDKHQEPPLPGSVERPQDEDDHCSDFRSKAPKQSVWRDDCGDAFRQGPRAARSGSVWRRIRASDRTSSPPSTGTGPCYQRFMKHGSGVEWRGPRLGAS